MTLKEFLSMPAFRQAKEDAEVWITHPDSDDCLPVDAWVLPFSDGSQNLIIKTQLPPEDLSEIRWLGCWDAVKKLNAANVGIFFYGNLFPYLRKRGELKGLCKKCGNIWLYDTEGIIKKALAGKFNYRPR